MGNRRSKGYHARPCRAALPLAPLLLIALQPACSSPLATTETSATAQAALSHGLFFGVRCEDDYQNNWQVNWNNNGMCNNFNSGITSRGDTLSFYYNNHDDKPYIESTSDTCLGCGGADSVDFFMTQSHGSNNATDGLFFLWNQNTTANTSQMRLGDNGHRASVFAAYSCSTMPADSNMWGRWGAPFRGGLEVALGAYDLVYNQNDQKGTELASRLENNEPIGFAWNEAVWYADNNNHPLAIATGGNNGTNDCANRRTTTTLANVLHIPVLQDGAITTVCWSGWN